MQSKFYLPLFIGTLLLTGCSKNTPLAEDTKSATVKTAQTAPAKPQITPEDDPKLTGTPVLGFKLRDSTFDSVKSRLNNYQLDDNYVSYADGPILENDGSGFNIDGLLKTQFGFDKNHKLVYVGMTIQEKDHMSKTTYHRVVDYVKQNGYQVKNVKAPFVGNQETVFVTPKQETIIVSEPHMGGFKVYVEYFTDDFKHKKENYLKEQQEEKTKAESANF